MNYNEDKNTMPSNDNNNKFNPNYINEEEQRRNTFNNNLRNNYNIRKGR